MDKGGYFPDALACCLIAIAISQDSTYQIGDFNNQKNDKLYDNSKLILACMDFLKTARIDIKNVGNPQNDISWINKQEYVRITTPGWFQSQNNGVGYVIESSILRLHLQGVIIGSGVLTISLLGLDTRDEKGNRFPSWVDFVSVKVNGVEQLSNEVSVWHDKLYRLSIPVVDQQQILISFEWKPHAYEKEELINMIEKIFQYLPLKG